MNLPKAIFFVTLLFSSIGNAQTEDTNTVLQISSNDKLVLKTDLHIPANTVRLDFGVEYDGLPFRGCSFLIKPAINSRKIEMGNALVFSGETNKTFGTVSRYRQYTYRAEVTGSKSIAAVECYGWLDRTIDLYIGGMKKIFAQIADFEPAPPEISNE